MDQYIEIPSSQCSEFFLTKNHLKGKDSCTICNKPKKKPLNTKAQAYDFQNLELANHEEKKQEKIESVINPQNLNNNKSLKNNVDPNNGKENDSDYDDQFFYDAERDSEIEDFMNYFEKLKNCECCKGNFYSCQGQVCESLGACYCYTKLKLEEESR